VRFTLSESVGKKARFIDSVVTSLGLANARVVNERAEDVLRADPADLLTARAVAPIDRAIALFGAAFKQGTRALLYKGPDIQAEITEAQPALKHLHLHARVIQTYDLPDAAGMRTIVEIKR
jgi:16S rRNA (guanine527-N7)-methyltransferase